MKQVTISARIPEDLSRELGLLAQALRRNRSWVIEEAIRGYIESERQFIEAVTEGIRADEAGDLISHETMMKEIDDLLASYPEAEK